MLGHLLLTSTLDQAFWLAVVLAVLRALRGDARWWAVAGAVAGVATYSRLLVAVLGVGLAAWAARPGRDRFCAPPGCGWERWSRGWSRCPTSSSRARTAGRSWRWGPRSRRTTPPRSARWRCPSCWSCSGPSSPWSGASVSSGCSDGRSGPASASSRSPSPCWWPSPSSPAPSRTTRCTCWPSCMPRGASPSPRGSPSARRGAGPPWPASPSTRWSRSCWRCRWCRSACSAGLRWPRWDRWSRTRSGGRRYVSQIADVYRTVPTSGRTAVVTSNYGEAGAVARLGPALGLPGALSGQNALYDAERPAGRRRHRRARRAAAAQRRRPLQDVSGPRQARQRSRRGQRGAGPADRGVHRTGGPVDPALAPVPAPGLRAAGL